VVAEEDGHEEGDDLLLEAVPGVGELEEAEDEEVRAVGDGEFEELKAAGVHA